VAQKIQILLIDDLDGSAAEGTVRFRLDGRELRDADPVRQCCPPGRKQRPQASPWHPRLGGA